MEARRLKSQTSSAIFQLGYSGPFAALTSDAPAVRGGLYFFPSLPLDTASGDLQARILPTQKNLSGGPIFVRVNTSGADHEWSG